MAAVSPKAVWAVGVDNSATLIEEWDGTSLKTVNSPNPGNVSNGLMGVTALSDGTVAAVGSQVSSTTGQTPLILQNAASAPKTPTKAVYVGASAPATGTTTSAPTTAMPAPLDTAFVDQLFAAAGKADQSLALAGHRSRTLEPSALGELDVLQGELWSMDRA
jgi:hypothetical protein